MTTDMLRCALRGVAAYRPVVDEPVMRLALGVLDKLSAGDGSGAVEDYARLFYALRSAGSRSLGEWLDGRLRDRESPYAALAERGGEDPALEAAARRDIETFTLLAELDFGAVPGFFELDTPAVRTMSSIRSLHVITYRLSHELLEALRPLTAKRIPVTCIVPPDGALQELRQHALDIDVRLVPIFGPEDIAARLGDCL